MPQNAEGSQTAGRSLVAEARNPACTSNDGKSQAEMGCRPDGHGSYHSQRVGESQGSGALASSYSCFSCHSEAQVLHRIKKDGSIHLYCTSCVLFHHKGMYCSQCFHVYSGPDQMGDPALWLTCSKCHRFCHMECAEKVGLPVNTFFFACRYCHHDSCTEDEPNVSAKRPRIDEGSSLSDQETLAAAQIVSIFATKEAKEAKARARACAAVAAKAAKLAKSALDIAHRAGLDELRWRLEAHQQTTVAASLNPTMKNLQTGAYIVNMRNQRTTVGLNNKSLQKMSMPSYHRIGGKSFSNMGSISDCSKATTTANLSHHQRRVLPPVVSPNVSGPSFMSSSHTVQKPPVQQQSSAPSAGSGQLASLSTFPKEQSLPAVSEGTEVYASPESILESAPLLRAPKSDSAAHPDALGRNRVHAANNLEILSDEEVVDDLVDVGDLLAEGFEKEGSVPDSLIDLTGSVDAAGLQEGTPSIKKCSVVSVRGADTGQSPGGMLPDNRGDLQ